MNQSVVEELLTQRDAVLFGTYVTQIPRPETDEACLMATGRDSLLIRSLEFGDLITSVCRELHPEWTPVGGAKWAWQWVDVFKPSREEVLTVLDEAIRRAKDMA